MRMTPDTEESIRCTASTCSCVCFKPGRVQLRSCDRCGHSWVAHALEKLQFRAQPPSSCGPVEVALPGLVFDLSSLVLYGAQAIPVRLKILLDRLYSILTPEQVGHILHTLGWSLGDYVRGYKLQHPSGKVLDRWLMVSPEEELLILKQFLRFGETRPIVELMSLQCLAAANHFSNPALSLGSKSFSAFTERRALTPGEFKNTRGDPASVPDVCRFKKNSPPDHNMVQHFEHFPGGLSLLLPFHFPNSAFHLPTKELLPPSKVPCLRKSSNSKLAERPKQEGRRGPQETDPNLQRSKDEPAIRIKADPDKPNPSLFIGHQKPWFHNDRDLVSKRENTSSLPPSLNSSLVSISPPPLTPSVPSSSLKNSQKLQSLSSHSLSPLPSFSSSFFSALPTSSFPSSLHPLPSTPPSLHPLPTSLCTLPSLSPAGGRKGRVCCGVCGKSFYDKGTLKIHYNAVHLKIKHRCTVAGCTMVFSSLRSRNRHSANPNPRLHTGVSRDVHTGRNATMDPRSGAHSETLIHKSVRKTVHNNARTQSCRENEIGNTLWPQDEDAHTLVHTHTMNTGLNCQADPQQADSPPPFPQPLKGDTNQDFPLSDSTYRFDLQTQAPPPQSASSPGSPPSLVPMVPQAPEKTDCCPGLQPDPTSPAPLPDPTSITITSCMSQPVPHDDGVPEQKQLVPLTNQQRPWETGDPLPKKKSRKSSMPVKIARERMEEGGNKDEEES
ncbi:zinc finger protein basonuclin-2-like [Notolabrus celidotus]|uniref:zinc finger protein basonuclin-2-like n=1 Tax=Notolabrus celidotus TaxID=1203425 RepID=UPI00148FBE20|nr:zinc finger protein basonuclin-2-like [Notolabrus celidotus]XP_034535232.1 zinc finger protein basonuclin-2-like [Notolabrus celidotus]XP_034535233.1 zinc finger protein basonuclin-2-like [Notolabrus celidotus]